MRVVVGITSQPALDHLAAIAQSAAEPREAFIEVGDLWLERQRRYMRTAAWVPLKPDSVRRKVRRGRPARPLLGGQLEKSLTRKGVNYSVRRIDKVSITLGTRDPVAHLHDQGTRGHLPQRRLIAVSRPDKDAYREVFARHLTQIRFSRFQATRRRSLL